MVEAKVEYQNTELGKIPQDWRQHRFEDVLDGFSSGMTPYRGNPSYYEGVIPWITSGELNYNVITDTIEKITPEAVRNTNLKLLPTGTFLMAITGLEAAGTRGSCAITGIKSTTNQSCMALFPKNNRITTEYLYYFYTRYGNELAFKYCQGTKQQSFTGRIVRRLPINLPPTLHEQQAIATVLSDTDALIRSLETLITKKQQVRQGVMQELLRPKEGWVERTLLELADNKKNRFDDGDWIESEHIQPSGIRLVQTGNIGLGSFLDKGEKKYISKNSFDLLKCKEVVEGDLLICRLAEPAGRACLMPNLGNGKVITSVDVTIFRPLPELANCFYLVSLFSTPEWLKRVSLVSGGTTHKRISRGSLGRLVIQLPPIEEQNKSAKVLYDLDKELTILNNKLQKTKLLKQALMQQLLTGKIRLV